MYRPLRVGWPYSVPENVTAKNGSKEYFYIRSGTSSIIAKGEVLDELRELASRIPFDERGNPDIKLEDISTLLLREYLVKVGSKLANELYERPLSEIMEQMDLYVGPSENRMLRNVAAMMFCENPSKFFKRTQVEVVFFPEGRLANPNNIYEAPIITGSVTQIIERTLEYLNRMVVMQTIIKPKNDNHSIKFYTYPYQALEESITNSLYHRDYREWEPVVITVEPKGITIQNVGGPDRSIPSADINRGELLISKRYRNRRLGEYLKELELTEGRSTGIPTIQNVLKANGSPRAIVVTDEERTFFRITIPCHEEAGNIIADIVSRDATKLPNGIKDGIKDGIKEPTVRQQLIVNLINQDDTITTAILAQKTGLSQRTLMRELTALQAKGFLTREGGRKDGKWVILNVSEGNIK
jgi:ATP-dependent DNA helicase RecG